MINAVECIEGPTKSSLRHPMLPTIAREDDAVVMIDQRKLPAKEVYVRCKTAAEVARAIKTMVIRGAPAIGVAAAMGIALGMRKKQGHRHPEARGRVLRDLRAHGVDPSDGRQPVLGDRSHEAVVCRGRRSGRVGRSDQGPPGSRGGGDTRRGRRQLPGDGRVRRRGGARTSARILTHCNAGALATAGYGTALGVVRAAVEAGKQVTVFADETRPFLQGARLTAWELVRDGIDTTVITDNMAGALMRRGQLDIVVVGADRIAANGDTANKIGTYTVAVLAREHNIPFYVAAPLSTIDLTRPDGAADSDRRAQSARGQPSRRQSAHAGRRPRFATRRST